jgi:XTP/dITP diphosphohydrolase
VKTVLIGTTNQGKVKDFKQLLETEGLQVISLRDLDDAIEVEETGTTFAENAILKAETLSRHYNKIVIADDSGLEIEALNGRPGVYSARYAGEHKSDEDNIKKVLAEMEGVPFHDRKAAFVCVLALAIPGKETKIFEGKCNGYITEQPKGTNGFGYDPIFYVPEKEKTMAELSLEEKNELSHRKKAIDKLIKYWNEHLQL